MVEKRESFPASLQKQVVEYLGVRIITGEIPAGTALSMDVLSQDLNVSRSVIREAMGILASLGLVVSHKRAGTIVQPNTNWDALSPQVIWWRLDDPKQRMNQFRSLVEMRIAFEPLAAALAAERASDEQAEHLMGVARRLEKAGRRGDQATYLVHDKVFHSLVLTLSDNHLFANLQFGIEEILEGRHAYGYVPRWPNFDAVDWHINIAEAVVAHDPEAAYRYALAIARRSAADVGLSDMLNPMGFSASQPVLD